MKKLNATSITLSVIAILWLILAVVCVILLNVSTAYVESHKDHLILHDPPSNVLTETKGICPSCGEPTYGFNDQLVCRNPNCDLYGLAVDIHEGEE